MNLTNALMWQEMVAAGVLSDPVPAADLDFNLIATSLPGGLTFTRNTGNAVYYNAAGVLSLAAANVPRFDYGVTPGANPLGLLMEDQRTNLFIQSASPATQNITCAVGTWSVSCLGSGSLTPSANGAVGTGFAAATGGAPTAFTITTAGSVTFTVGGSISRPQVELGTPATSPITTAASSSFRLVDSCVSTSGVLSSVAGTLAVEALYASTNCDLIGVDDGTVSNIYSLRGGGTSKRLSGSSFLGGTGQPSTAFSPNNTSSPGIIGRAALRYNGNQLSVCGAGSYPQTVTVTPLSTISRLVIGQQRSSAPNGYIRRARYWAKALTDIEMAAITV